MHSLYLIPNTIAESFDHIPLQTREAIVDLRLFFVEEPKSARALLKALNPDFPLRDCQFLDLNEHTKASQIKEYINLLGVKDAGIISESGCPCVADPGADLVCLAHQNNIDVVPLVGPSSILLALMASGLSGQNFAFNGYLPKDERERVSLLKKLEERIRKEGQTQIFMDTPYRNQQVLDEVLKSLNPQMHLCIALDVGGASQMIKTRTIKAWQNANIQLPKKPALFIINK